MNFRRSTISTATQTLCNTNRSFIDASSQSDSINTHFFPRFDDQSRSIPYPSTSATLNNDANEIVTIEIMPTEVFIKFCIF